MKKNYIISAIILLIIAASAYVYKDAIFFKTTYEGVQSEFLTEDIAFQQDTPETEILAFKAQLEKQPGVSSVTYVSIEEGIKKLIESNPIVKEDKVVLDIAKESILPRLIITLGFKNADKNLTSLKQFIASSSIAAYIK